MPIHGKVAYSKPITLPSGYKTLALYDKDNKIIDYRICEYDKATDKFKCPSKKTHPRERKKLAKKLGI